MFSVQRLLGVATFALACAPRHPDQQPEASEPVNSGQAQPAAAEASPTEAAPDSKEAWLERMTTAIPAMFCRSDQFFRQCFAVGEEECLETARLAFKSCASQNEAKLPASFDETSGQRWGQTLGACAGSNYEMTLTAKKKGDPKCADPTAWGG